jgi:hypothetical protein
MANNNRSSGFDFSDRSTPDQYEQHPDMPIYNPNAAPRSLQRNKTERMRLQGLQRSNTTASQAFKAPATPTGFWAHYNRWMINEGGRILFFGTWIFLHLLVAVFGFFHYQLKDNSVGARATFGITFRESKRLLCRAQLSSPTSYRSHGRTCASC